MDKASDIVDVHMAGFCKDCMVLRAGASISDKDGNRLGIKDSVYVHHIILTDVGRTPVSPPTERVTCPTGPGGGLTLITPKGSENKDQGHAGGHSKRWPQISGLTSLLGPTSVFIGKGNEADDVLYAAPKSNVKSGYWISKNDKMAGQAEVINYKTTAQEVYLAIDMEYLPSNGTRPEGYMDVGQGLINVDACTSFNLSM